MKGTARRLDSGWEVSPQVVPMQLDSIDSGSPHALSPARSGIRKGVVGVLLLSLLAGPIACEQTSSATPEVRAEPQAAPAAVVEPTAAQAAPAEPQGQADYREEGFDLSVEVPSDAEVGKPTTATVVLEAKAPYKVNQEYPIKLTLSESSGLSFPSPRVGKEAVTLQDKKAFMKVELTPKSAGTHTLAGRLSFSVCTDERCLIEKRDLAAPIVVR